MTAPRERRPWMPSNGTDGMVFTDIFCDRCKRESAYRATVDAPPAERQQACPILMASLCGEQPPEWTDDGTFSDPQCSAFELDPDVGPFVPTPPPSPEIVARRESEDAAEDAAVAMRWRIAHRLGDRFPTACWGAIGSWPLIGDGESLIDALLSDAVTCKAEGATGNPGASCWCGKFRGPDDESAAAP